MPILIVILLILAFLLGQESVAPPVGGFDPEEGEIYGEGYDLGEVADQYARKHGLDPRLFRALITAESAWNPDAVSPVGARGLTQVMPATGRSECGLSADELLDVEKNLDCGASYLAQMLAVKNGSIPHALASYNAGPGNAERALKSWPETRRYVRQIMAEYEGE